MDRVSVRVCVCDGTIEWPNINLSFSRISIWLNLMVNYAKIEVTDLNLVHILYRCRITHRHNNNTYNTDINSEFAFDFKMELPLDLRWSPIGDGTKKGRKKNLDFNGL